MDQDRVIAGIETELFDLLPCNLDLRLEQVGRTDGDRLFTPEHQSPQLVVRGDRRPAVQALQVVLQLLRHRSVALAPDHVVDSLGGDQLADRGYQRRIAEVLANVIGLLEHLAEAVHRVVRAELAVDVLEHETWHAVAQDARVDSVGHRAQVLDVAALQLLDVVLDIPHLVEVEAGVVLAALQSRDHALRGRLRSTPCERRYRDIEDLSTRLDRRHVRHRRHAAGAVRVDGDWDLDHRLERRDQLPGRLRAEQPRRVLDHDLVAAHVDQALGERSPQLEVVRGRDRVAQRALHFLLRFGRGRDRRFHVAKVVERIEDSKYVHASLRGVLDEQLDGVIGEVALGDQVLAADQRLDRRVWRRLVQLAEKVPRVLVDEELRFKRRAAERFHGGKADGVHLGRDRNDLVRTQVATKQGLLRVAQRRVDEAASSFARRPLHDAFRISVRGADLELVRQTEIFEHFDARLHQR